MFSITSLGSCRIATPLRLMQDTYGYEINKNRNYGFSHTSSEAVQMMNFMKGEFNPSQEIWELISRGKDAQDIINMPVSESNLYIVEISSAKLLSIGDDCVQLNYLVNRFNKFFSCIERAKAYWRVTSKDEQSEIDIFLKNNWSETDQQITDSKLLSRVRRTQMNEDQIRSDVRKLLQGLPNVLFITHVNAKKVDGEVIKSRAQLINSVKKIVTEEGGVVYDPTSRMLEIGQETAIEDHSDSLAHFTESFAKILFTDWYELHISNVIDSLIINAGDSKFEELYPHYQALVNSNKINNLPERLNNLEAHGINSAKLFELNAKLHSLIGNERKSKELLSKSLEQHPKNVDLLSQYFEVCLSKGDFDKACDTCNELLELGVNPSADEAYSLGRALLDGKKLEYAFSFFKLALQLNPKHSMASNKIEEMLLNQSAKLEQLNNDEIPTITSLFSVVSLFKLGLLELDLTTDFAQEKLISEYNENDIFDILSLKLDAGESKVSAEILEKYQTKGYGSLESLAKINTGLVKLAEKLLAEVKSQNNLGIKLNLMHDTVIAFPTLKEVRVEARELRRETVNYIRSKYKDNDLKWLADLKQTMRNDIENIIELELFLGRLYFAKEDYICAYEHSLNVTYCDAENLSGNTLLMRSALKIGEFRIAKEACEKVCSLNNDSAGKLQDEANLHLSRIPKQSFLEARNETDVFRRLTLLNIAKDEPLFAKQCIKMKDQIYKTLISTVVTKEKSLDNDLIPFAKKVNALIPENNRVLMIIGRNLVKQKDFKAAEPYWSKLMVLEPANNTYEFQHKRCMLKLAEQL